MMIPKLTGALFVFAFLPIHSIFGQTIGKPIQLEELNNRPVIGTLGLPLGRVVEIEAEIISGAALFQKRYSSQYLLKITHIKGEKPKEQPLLEFETLTFNNIKIASDPFSLYELKTGKKAGRLTSAQLKELEQGYVGKKVKLVVYERGAFIGSPPDLPDDVPIYADVAFHFSTSLTVLAQREAGE